MKLLYRAGADLTFMLHITWVAIGLFGFLLPNLWYVYLAVLTLGSYLLSRRCVFTVWEFHLRRKADPGFTAQSDWMPYYTYRLTHERVSNTFWHRSGMIFISSSLLLNLSFHYFLR